MSARNGSLAAADLGLIGSGANIAGGVLTGSVVVSGLVTLDGRFDNDTLIGSAANDRLTGGGGNNTINGGGGINTLVETDISMAGNANFTLTNTSLTLSLPIASNQVDTLSSIQQAELTGGVGDNVLDASAFTAGSVLLIGSDGNDVLKGGSGNDILSGGGGIDTLNGGGGVNTAIEIGDGRFVLAGTAASSTLDMGEGPTETVQDSLSGTVTGGTFKLSFGGQTTDAIAYNASAQEVNAALNVLYSIGDGNVTVT